MARSCFSFDDTNRFQSGKLVESAAEEVGAPQSGMELLEFLVQEGQAGLRGDSCDVGQILLN